MNLEMNLQTLQRQNVEFLGTGGRSQENRSLGFRPAFMDQETSAVYQACFADGRTSGASLTGSPRSTASLAGSGPRIC